MNKSLIAISTAIIVIVIGSSAINAPKRVTYTDGNSVTGYSSGCQGCHGSTTSPGGSIVLAGVPDTCIAGQSYPISITLTDAVQKRWGFDMAVGSGAFSLGSNSNVVLSGTKNENAHHGTSAPVAPPPTYTFDSLYWTAPATIPAGGKVKFAFAGNAANDNNATSGDHTYKGTFTTIVIANTVPVKLESFNAVISNSEVKISWATASELNTDHFEVERSVDGQNFVLANKVVAAGNSSTTKNYAYTDNASNLTGIVYYRLKTVNKDGSSSYSNVTTVTIHNSQLPTLSIYPNPLRAGQDLKLTYLSEKTENVNLQVINIVGKKVSATNVSVSEGRNVLSLPVGHLASGVYYIAVSVNNVIVQKTPVVIQ